MNEGLKLQKVGPHEEPLYTMVVVDLSAAKLLALQASVHNGAKTALQREVADKIIKICGSKAIPD